MSDLQIGAWSDDLLSGLWVTVYMTVLSAALAAAIALVLGLLARMDHLAPRTFARVVIEFFRGTSLLVQLFWLFYALPLWGYQLDPKGKPRVATSLEDRHCVFARLKKFVCR